MWTYLTVPFSLTWAGFQVAEIEPWNGQEKTRHGARRMAHHSHTKGGSTPVKTGHTATGVPLAVALQLAGAGLILISAFVPWVRSHALFLTVPVRGAETDYGRLFPAVALVVFILLAYQWSFRRHRWMHGVVLGLGILALAVAVVYGARVTQRVGKIDTAAHQQQTAPPVLGGGRMFSVEFDVGYYLTLLGSGALIAGSIAGL